MNSPGFAGGAVRERSPPVRPSGMRRGTAEALGAPLREALALAAQAPSAHNAQPWSVLVRDPRRWVLSLATDRRLPALDPGDHAALISLGAFLENLDRAAAAAGYRVDIERFGQHALDPDLVALGLTAAAAPSGDVESLAERRTPRVPFDRRKVAPADLEALCAGVSGWLWFPSGAPVAERLRELAAGAAAAQAGRPDAQAELSAWLHAHRHDAREGLDIAELGLSGFSGWVAGQLLERHRRDPGFLRHALADQAARLGRHCGGWLLLCSPAGPVEPLLATGRALQRVLLRGRALGLGLQPVSAPLHEPGWRQSLEQATGVSEFPRVLLRVGYNRRWPGGRGARRPPEAFVRVAC